MLATCRPRACSRVHRAAALYGCPARYRLPAVPSIMVASCPARFCQSDTASRELGGVHSSTASDVNVSMIRILEAVGKNSAVTSAFVRTMPQMERQYAGGGAHHAESSRSDSPTWLFGLVKNATG